MSTEDFNKLVKDNHHKLYSQSNRFFPNDPYMKLDLVQEVLIKSIKKIETFNSESDFLRWCTVVMKTTVIDWQRRQKNRSTIPLENATSVSCRNSLDPVDSNILKDILELRDEFRKPIQLFMEGYSYKEIAAVLNIPKGTVCNFLFRARKILSEKIKERETFYKK